MDTETILNHFEQITTHTMWMCVTVAAASILTIGIVVWCFTKLLVTFAKNHQKPPQV